MCWHVIMCVLQVIFCIFDLIRKQSAELLFVTIFDEGENEWLKINLVLKHWKPFLHAGNEQGVAAFALFAC